jgi:tRNA A-37 threonylcarbamoyl transferase component Bud32
LTDKPSIRLELSRAKAIYADGEAQALLSGALEALCDPDRAGWERVKSSPSRTVWRGPAGAQEVYVKHFHRRSLSGTLRRLAGMSEARTEARVSRFLAQNGVPTPRALAHLAAGGAEWLATAAVPHAQPLTQWHQDQLSLGPRGQAAIRRMTARLGDLVGRMHACGVLHRDLHCGNLLVTPGEDGLGDLVLMDLHRIRQGRRFSQATRARNLAQLFHDRFEFASRSDLLRFLKHYLAAQAEPWTVRGWAYLVESFAAGHRRRHHANRDRRILADEGRYFARLKVPGGWRGHVILASKAQPPLSRAAQMTFTVAQWAQALGDPAALLRDGAALRDVPEGMLVRRKLMVGGRELDVFIKLLRRPWLKALGDRLRSSRAVRSFELGHRMLIRRVPAALPLACLELRRGLTTPQSILITEAVEGLPLKEFLTSALGRSGDSMGPAERHRLSQSLLWELGRMLQRLHDNGFAHRDLKADSIVITCEPPSAVRAVLVNVDGVRHCRWLSARRRFQGLMRLNVSLLESPVVNRAGRLRMLLGYLRRPGQGRMNFKPHWQALADWSARKRRSQIRTRRKRQKDVRR